MKLNEHQLYFLSELVRRGGSATSKELGGYSKESHAARSRCKSVGFAVYRGVSSQNGYWHITDEGRKAVEQLTCSESADKQTGP